MKIQLNHRFEDIISVENLLLAWKEFLSGKRQKKDVGEFSLRLMDNIFSLHCDLIHHTYKHGGYQAFKINDPKPRDIHKATVRDRLLHHAIYRILYPFFDRTFIADSYSCRENKGTHKAINKFREYFYKASKNNTRPCWVLKCDLRKFFASIDHGILINILDEYIPDKNILWLLENVINSFASPCRPHPSLSFLRRGELNNDRGSVNVGLPLGNLTSQLFVNIYMNKFDQFMKHKLKAKHYIRYADDFIIISDDKTKLLNLTESVRRFLNDKLKLELHPDKIFIKTISSGVDFLGMVSFPDHRILRTKTKRRMFKKIEKNGKRLHAGLLPEKSFQQSLASYRGILKHGNGHRILKKIEQMAI